MRTVKIPAWERDEHERVDLRKPMIDWLGSRLSDIPQGFVSFSEIWRGLDALWAVLEKNGAVGMGDVYVKLTNDMRREHRVIPTVTQIDHCLLVAAVPSGRIKITDIPND